MSDASSSSPEPELCTWCKTRPRAPDRKRCVECHEAQVASITRKRWAPVYRRLEKDDRREVWMIDEVRVTSWDCWSDMPCFSQRSDQEAA